MSQAQTHIPQTLVSTRQRVLMLAVGYGLLECALWTQRPMQFMWSLLAAAWIVGCVVASRASARELGLGRNGWRHAWIIAAAAALAFAMSVVAYFAGTLHPLFGILPQIPHSLMYAVWAFQQEFILQCFFFENLRAMMDAKRAIMTSAVLFSAAHIPNPVLMTATLAMSLAFTAAFSRYRNLYVLAIAHAILGLAVATSIPDDVHRHMRVGLGWYTYPAKYGARR